MRCDCSRSLQDLAQIDRRAPSNRRALFFCTDCFQPSDATLLFSQRTLHHVKVGYPSSSLETVDRICQRCGGDRAYIKSPDSPVQL